MEDILVPLGFFAMVAAIVIVPRYLKSLERQKLQETLRASIEKGAELPPEVVQALTSDAKPAPSPYRDLRAGIIWLGVAVGLSIAVIVSAVGIPMPPPPNANVGYTAYIRIMPADVLTAALIGLAATVLAALLPARRSSAASVVDALRQGT